MYTHKRDGKRSRVVEQTNNVGILAPQQQPTNRLLLRQQTGCDLSFRPTGTVATRPHRWLRGTSSQIIILSTIAVESTIIRVHEGKQEVYCLCSSGGKPGAKNLLGAIIITDICLAGVLKNIITKSSKKLIFFCLSSNAPVGLTCFWAICVPHILFCPQ